MSEALSVIEKDRLTVLEETIEKNLHAFYEVGNALMEIRDSKLYRESHGTFEGYCRDKWNISRPRAYQLIDSAEAMGNLSTMVDKKELPLSERITRELSKLKDPDDQRGAWGALKEEKPIEEITAKDVERKVKEITESKRPKVDIYQNVRLEPELISPEFEAAFEHMKKAIYNERGTKWKTTGREVALKYINVLLDMAGA